MEEGIMSRHAPLILVFAIHLAACGGTVKADQPDGTADAPSDGHLDMATEPGDDPATEVTDDPADDPIEDHHPTDTGPTPGDLGDPCTNAGDCTELPGESRFCATEVPMGPAGTVTFPGGYCSMGCRTDVGCGEGGYCLGDPMSGDGMCFKLCDSEDDCRTSEGYSCTSLPGPTTTPDMCFPPMW